MAFDISWGTLSSCINVSRQVHKYHNNKNQQKKKRVSSMVIRIPWSDVGMNILKNLCLFGDDDDGFRYIFRCWELFTMLRLHYTLYIYTIRFSCFIVSLVCVKRWGWILMKLEIKQIFVIFLVYEGSSYCIWQGIFSWRCRYGTEIST